jgi:uncharacterized protein (DUF885 family)
MTHRFLVLFAAIVSAGACAAPADDFIARYGKAYNALDMSYLRLSYRDNIANLVRETNIPVQKKFFAEVRRDLGQLDRGALSACQQLDLHKIAFETDANLQKLAVLEKQSALGGKAVIGETGLHGLPLGRDWYRYFLKRWLTSDVTPEELKSAGEAELANVVARYRRLQAKMGYAGKDQAFYAYLKGPAFMYPKGETPKADYEARQATVFANLHKLFPPHTLEPAIVSESSRGDAFPADGYYESESRTFYFNKNGPGYQRRNVDMLLLHESTPGHHFQSHYASQAKGGCAAAVPPVFYAAFGEGWGAYVEEFGAELGVYREPSDELGAVEWDLVRSIRVVLDVGINYEGWTERQAYDYWHQQLPMLPQLADREIKRVREWPVQAITYKYGSAMIRKMRAAEQARLGSAFDIRTFHDTLLRNGPLPLALLPELFRSSAPLVALAPQLGDNDKR